MRDNVSFLLFFLQFRCLYNSYRFESIRSTYIRCRLYTCTFSELELLNNIPLLNKFFSVRFSLIYSLPIVLYGMSGLCNIYVVTCKSCTVSCITRTKTTTTPSHLSESRVTQYFLPY